MANPLTDFLTLVDQAGNAYIASTVANIASAVEPTFRLLLILFFILYGLGIWRGAIRTDATQFFWALIKIGIIYTVVFTWAIYNAVVVDFLTNGPDALAAVISGAPKSTITSAFGTTYEKVVESSSLATQGSGYVFKYIIALIIWISGSVVIIYTAFLIGLAKFALSLLVGIGPIAFIMLFYDATRRMFEAWLQQCLNFFLYIAFTLAVLTLTNSIFFTTVKLIPEEAVDITLGSIIPLVVTCFVIWLVLKQIPALASSIAGGVQLSSLGIESSAARTSRRGVAGAARRGWIGSKKAWGAYKNRRLGSRNSVRN